MRQLPTNPTGDQISKHVQDALDQRESDNAFGVSLVPFHKHTGTDSPQISYNNLTDVPATTVFVPTKIEFNQLVRVLSPYVTSPPAINSDWTRAIFQLGSSVAQAIVFTNPFGASRIDGFWNRVGVPNITSGGVRNQCAYHKASDQFFIAKNGGAIYVYQDNNTLSGETSCTISGYTLGTKCQGIASDGTNLYMLDNSTSQVVTFSVSGSTLTYVSTSATIGLGSTNLYLCAVDTNNWYLFYTVGSYDGTEVYKITKSSGATASSTPIQFTDGVMNDPSGNIRVTQRTFNQSSAESVSFGYGLYITQL